MQIGCVRTIPLKSILITTSIKRNNNIFINVTKIMSNRLKNLSFIPRLALIRKMALRRVGLNLIHKRNINFAAPLCQKATDPIQQLFLDKLKEYKTKSGGGSKLVDPSPEIERELKQEMTKLSLQYGGKDGADMTKFPDIKFTDVKLDPIDIE